MSPKCSHCGRPILGNSVPVIIIRKGYITSHDESRYERMEKPEDVLRTYHEWCYKEEKFDRLQKQIDAMVNAIASYIWEAAPDTQVGVNRAKAFRQNMKQLREVG